MSRPFHILLSDDHRDALESIRAKNGLRSEADAVRWLIEQVEPAAKAKRDAVVALAEEQKITQLVHEDVGNGSVGMSRTQARKELETAGLIMPRAPVGSRLKGAK